MVKPLMTREEVSRLLNISLTMVDALRADGTLTWVQVGKRAVRIHGDSVRPFVELPHTTAA